MKYLSSLSLSPLYLSDYDLVVDFVKDVNSHLIFLADLQHPVVTRADGKACNKSIVSIHHDEGMRPTD